MESSGRVLGMVPVTHVNFLSRVISHQVREAKDNIKAAQPHSFSLQPWPCHHMLCETMPAILSPPRSSLFLSSFLRPLLCPLLLVCLLKENNKKALNGAIKWVGAMLPGEELLNYFLFFFSITCSFCSHALHSPDGRQRGPLPFGTSIDFRLKHDRTSPGPSLIFPRKMMDLIQTLVLFLSVV